MIASRDIRMHLWWWQLGERWSVHHMFGNGIVHQALITHQAGPELWINILSLQQLQLQHTICRYIFHCTKDICYRQGILDLIHNQTVEHCLLLNVTLFSTVCWPIYDTGVHWFSLLPFVQYCSIVGTFRSTSSRQSWILLPWPLPSECGQMHRLLWGSPCWRRWWHDWGQLCHQMHRTFLALYWGTNSCTSNTCPPFLSLLEIFIPQDSQAIQWNSSTNTNATHTRQSFSKKMSCLRWDMNLWDSVF